MEFYYIYLSRCAYALPQAEIADEVDSNQTQAHFPFHTPQVINSRALVQFQDGSTESRKQLSFNYKNMKKSCILI